MSQSIEAVGCRVAGGPNGELWGVFDRLSLDIYIQLQPYSLQGFELPVLLRCNIRAKYYNLQEMSKFNSFQAY